MVRGYHTSSKMQTYQLGASLEDRESINVEFKEFCLKESVYNLLNKRQLRSLIYDSCFPKRFNDLILFNIYKYLEVYLAKYVSSFHNCSTRHSHMTFIVGVNDDAEVTGIPFKGDLFQHRGALQKYCEYLVENDLSKVCCLSVNLRVEECDVNVDALDDELISTQLRMQQKQRNHYTIVNRKFKKKRKQWNKAIMKYKGKLQNVFDDPHFQDEFKEFLRDMNLLSEFEEEIKTSYTVDLDKVKEYKTNKGTFMYWLIHFKDLKVAELLQVKPKSPVFPKQLNVEFCAVTQLSNLRHRWISNNPSLKYYVLKIEIEKDSCCGQTVPFIDPRRRHWRTVERYLEDNDPKSKDI